MLTVKFGGCSIMVWDSFSWFGLSSLVSVPKLLNTDTYRDMLDNSFLPTLGQHFRIGLFLFQHDNMPVNKVHSIATWFADMELKELNWATHSPYLNKIKHFWDELELKVACHTYLANYKAVTTPYYKNNEKFLQQFTKT